MKFGKHLVIFHALILFIGLNETFYNMKKNIFYIITKVHLIFKIK